MSTHKENFKHWFSDTIESLYENENAGFPILMLTFPLLERYLRSKSQTYEKSLKKPFYNELLNLFPTLTDRTNAESFWEIYRHGILHQATLSQKKNHIDKIWISNYKKDAIFYEKNVFYVNPVEFAKKVIDIINNDFPNYEALEHSSHPLATKQIIIDGFNGTCGYAQRMSLSVRTQNTK
ncbi:MAG: hypothetical protein QMD11_04370 [Smithella sp.]|nr:hypothetical protein [Smithella sp.]